MPRTIMSTSFKIERSNVKVIRPITADSVLNVRLKVKVFETGKPTNFKIGTADGARAINSHGQL